MPTITGHLRYQRESGLLGILLCIGGITCFAVACYLHSARLQTPAVRVAINTPRSSVVPATPESVNSLPQGADERYLSYLPHSGFHNQRIALENALVLANLLNRTLILPPARLGKPLHYSPFALLRNESMLATKENLAHCALQSGQSNITEECLEANSWTTISWQKLVNVSDIPVRYIESRELQDGIIEKLGLEPKDVFTLPDETMYNLRFVDVPIAALKEEDIQTALAQSRSFYGARILHIDNLRARSERLIEVGTLFGTSRLWLSNPENVRLRHLVRSRMVFQNFHVRMVADKIGSIMGKNWLGAHIRIGDGAFKTQAESNVREIWRKLISKPGLEFKNGSVPGAWKALESNSDLYSNKGFGGTSEYPQHPTWACLETFQHSSRMQFKGVRVPLYISTDTQNPRQDPVLAPLLGYFPCAFFLEDFVGHVSQDGQDIFDELSNLRGDDDGLELLRFFIPLIDAMVVGKARRFVGTRRSTFSHYVKDVLVPLEQGRDIHDR